MPDRLLVRAIGVLVEIDASSWPAGSRAEVREAWADAAEPGGGVPDVVVEATHRGDTAAALAALSTDVTLAALAARRGDALWMLHAAGLARDDGRVVVLSAASGTGKTTAARHLARRHAYVSDETVAITAGGAVTPYRKPLSIIREGRNAKEQVAPSRLGLDRPLPDDLSVARIIVLDRRPDAPAVPEVTALDDAEAIALLAPQTSYLSDAPAPLHLITRILADTGGAVRLRYREAADLDDVIADLLDGSSAASRSESDRSAVATASGGGGEYVRADVVDALALDDGRIALLQRSGTGSEVRVLDGIGPVLWEAADGRDLAGLVAAVVAEHGEPGGADAAGLVSSALDVLVADGVLRRGRSQT